MQLNLYIKNHIEELISRVELHDVHLKGAERLVISSFTRDPSVLNKTWGRAISMTCCGDQKHFSGFGSYLRERGKAGEIRCNGNKIIVLPPSTSSLCTTLECLTDIPLPKTESKTPDDNTSGGFLANLLRTIDAAPVPTMSLIPDEEMKRDQHHRELQDFEDKIREDLEEFVKDDSRTEHHMTAMEKPERSIVHNLAEEFAELVSADIGEAEEKHVVVYKKGHQPPDMVTHVDKSQIKYLNSRASERSAKQAKLGAAPPVTAATSLQETKSVKRDRRAISEIQAEFEQKKKRLDDT